MSLLSSLAGADPLVHSKIGKLADPLGTGIARGIGGLFGGGGNGFAGLFNAISQLMVQPPAPAPEAPPAPKQLISPDEAARRKAAAAGNTKAAAKNPLRLFIDYLNAPGASSTAGSVSSGLNVPQ